MATYSISYGCTNCGWWGTINVKKGTEASQKMMCSICKCFTAEKGWTKPGASLIKSR